MSEPTVAPRAAVAAETIPQELEAGYRPPAVAADRPWLVAVLWPLTVLLAPRWAGPRLLRSGRVVNVLLPYTCLVVSLLAFASGVLILVRDLSPIVPLEFAPWPTLHADGTTDALRWLLAAAVDALYIASDGRGDIAMVIGVLVGLRLGYALLGLLAAPLICVGEPARLALWRAWRLSLHSSVWLAVAAVGFLVLTLSPALNNDSVAPTWWSSGAGRLENTAGAVLVLWLSLVWTLRMGRDVPATIAAMATAKREPRCGGCGYRLTGLPRDRVCPECGKTLRESLVTPLRLPWQQRVPTLRRPAAWVTTVRAIVRDPGCVGPATLAIATDQAVRFACWNAAAAALVALPVGYVPISVVFDAPLESDSGLAWASGLALWLAGVQLLWLAAVSLHASVAASARRAELRRVATAASLASALWLPGWTLAVVAPVLWAGLLWAWARLHPAESGPPTVVAVGVTVVAAALLASGLLLLGKGLVRHMRVVGQVARACGA